MPVSEDYPRFESPSFVEPPLTDVSLMSSAAPGSAMASITRHKLLVVSAGLILAAAGAAIGIVRKPTYTSSTTVQVGTVNLNSPGFYGFVQSASALATVFSRSIMAEPVLTEIRAKLGVSPTEATRRLSAEPLPISPSFRVIATGPTAAAAVNLANTASAAVISYNAHSSGTSSPPATPLLLNYDRAARSMQYAAAKVARLEHSRKPESGEDTALLLARSEEDSARVHAQALSAAYRSALINAEANPPTGLLSLVAGAVTASSDRTSGIELFAFTGLLAGLVLGAVLAALYEHRRSLRPRSG